MEFIGVLNTENKLVTSKNDKNRINEMCDGTDVVLERNAKTKSECMIMTPLG